MSAEPLPRPEAYVPDDSDPATPVGGNPLLRGFLVMVSLGVVGAALGASLTDSSTSESIAEPRKIPVEVISAEPVETFQVERTYTGTIAARRSSQLGFQRSAIIVEVMVDQGDAVRQGQPLALLDTRHLRIQYERVKAQRQEAMAVLEELQAGPRRQTIAAARATVDELKADVELQRRQFVRSNELVKDYATPRERLDEAELGLRSAEARLQAAQQRLAELEAGTRLEQIAAQSAVVAQLDQQLADLQVDIDDSRLLAPFDGRIAQRLVDEGTVVAPAQPVLELVESGELEARVGVPAAALRSLDTEQPLDVWVDEKRWPARFVRAAPELDVATRTRTVILSLDPSASDHVVPGQIARITIEQPMSTDGFWLPTAALVRSVRGLWAAYVVEAVDGQQVVRRQDVEVLHTDGQRTLVRGMLHRGDQVITGGTHRVVPGQAVTIQ
jgi:RND family efflux transporter MFP subunit